MIIFIVISIVCFFIISLFYYKYKFSNILDKGNLELSIETEAQHFIENGNSVGLVVAIYKDNKNIVKSFGVKNLETGIAPDENTVFQIGSVTKIFTASLLQILCDEGVVDMDSTLKDLIGDITPLAKKIEQVSLRELVTHTSGFPKIPRSIINKINDITGKKNILINPYSYLELKDILDYLKDPDEKCISGKFNYSNYGMGLLGHILEICTEKSLNVLFDEKIFTPLNMNNSTIEITHEMSNNLATGYTKKNKETPMWDFGALAGAGALSSTASDMIRFVIENITSNSILSKKFKKMHIKQFNGKTGIGWMLPSMLEHFFGESTIVWHNGMVGGYTSYVSIDTENNTGVVILSNKMIDVTFLGLILSRHTRTQSWANI